jgi:hypothetical protein
LGDEATADLLDTLPGIVFTTGDNAYPDGSTNDFAFCYEPSWGRHRDRTRPSPGNHDYHTSGASAYFSYFGENAGPAGRGYYSYRAGEWLVLSLNSNIDVDPGSSQDLWLRDELAADPRTCTLAYWHHAGFSSSSNHGNSLRMQAIFQVLYDAGADVVLTGHDHTYERFGPQTPAGEADTVRGIRQFVVGTGGGSLYGFGSPVANSEFRYSDRHGVLELTLFPDRYAWRFIVEGGDVVDAGTGDCH